MDEPDGALELRARALRLLARREHTRQELERKLSPHAESSDAVKALLSELKARNQFSEARFAEERARWLSRKYGAAKIRQDLKAKGVPDELVQQVSSAGELERARAILERKYRTPATTREERAKRARFLLGRGFSYELVRKALAGLAVVVLGSGLLATSRNVEADAKPTIGDAAIASAARHGLTQSSTPFYNINIENIYGGIWRRYGAQNGSPVVLELGPGGNISQGVAFVMRGARKYYGLDIRKDDNFQNASAYEAVAALLEAVAPSLNKVKAATIFTVERGSARFNPERLAFLHPYPSHDIPLPDGAVDYAFSNLVMEHVSEPEGTIKALGRILKKGGVTAHQIDMRNHRDYSRPLDHLMLDPDQWGKVNAARPAHQHENRWRLSQFRASFERNGFRIVSVDVNDRAPVAEDLRQRLHPDFQQLALDDLAAVGARLVALKQ